jgi:hypothetical protein
VERAGVDDVKVKRIATFVCPSVVPATWRAKSPLCYAVNAGTGCRIADRLGLIDAEDTAPRADGLFLDAAGNSSEGSVSDPWYDSGTAELQGSPKSSLSQVASQRTALRAR